MQVREDAIDQSANSLCGEFYDIKLVKCMWDDEFAIMIIFNNISKLVQVQRQDNIIKFKNKIIDSMSHNLKTPLNAISLLCDESILVNGQLLDPGT